jgi:MoaA/NifB/PqqE/SkfB family radical SAM enzyme
VATLGQKWRLLRGLLRGDVAPNGPFYADVALTRRCNCRCIGCRYHPTEGHPLAYDGATDFSADLFHRLCEELPPLGTHMLVLHGGGEPFLHPQLPQFLAEAKQARFNVSMITNGTLLDRDTIAMLFDRRLDQLKVSLWASTVEQYERIRPGSDPDDFARVVASLRNVARIKAERGIRYPSVRVHCVITRENYDTLDAFAELVIGCGAESVSFSPFHHKDQQQSQHAPDAAQQAAAIAALGRVRRRLDARRIEHNVGETLLRYRIGPASWTMMPCYVPWFHAYVNEDGWVQPCGRGQLMFGDLAKNSFAEIWNGPAARALRRRLRTREGVAAVAKTCHCEYCCYFGDNLKVHRFARWLAPFAGN